MKHFIGLDVSLKETQVCVVDETGATVADCREATRPDLLASAIGRLAPSVERVVLETGGQSSWLQRALRGLGVPAVIVDARQAKAALSCRMNKTDANDAEGLAQLARTGWYREVRAKRPEAALGRSLLLARQQLVKQRRDMENQVRALLRGFGLVVGTVSCGRFEERVWGWCGASLCWRTPLGRFSWCAAALATISRIWKGASVRWWEALPSVRA